VQHHVPTWRVIGTLGLLVSLLVSGVGVAAQDGSPGAPSSPLASSPTAPDPLVAGLLQEEDLPLGMTAATDVEEGVAYDVDDAAFVANEGVRMVSRTWGGEGDLGTSIAFDLRMQFPTPEAAAAYLLAAMPTLSEVDATGLAPLDDVPVLGDETHAFGLDTQGEDGPVTIRTYLIRVGPVVAKVLAGGGGLTGDAIEALAAAATERMTASGPPVPGSPRPAPTATPAGSPLTPLPSGDLVELLLSHVPEVIAPTCVADDQRLWEGELVTLVCAPIDVDVQVTYSGFDTLEHMGAGYQSSLDTIDLSDLAASCDLGTWTGSYQVEGDTVGQLTCWSEPNGRAIMWSDDRLSILSVAVSRTLDAAGLYLWWLGAGPGS
jgi:hypothetical protein